MVLITYQMYMYIYIYIEREREIDLQRASGDPSVEGGDEGLPEHACNELVQAACLDTWRCIFLRQTIGKC